MTNKEAIAVFKGFKFLPREQKAVDLAIKALEERPQGEWIDIDSLVSKAMCSNCKNIIITEPFGKPNFCPNCGADMKEKPNQLRDCENCIHHSENGCEVWECEFKKRSDL